MSIKPEVGVSYAVFSQRRREAAAALAPVFAIMASYGKQLQAAERVLQAEKLLSQAHEFAIELKGLQGEESFLWAPVDAQEVILDVLSMMMAEDVERVLEAQRSAQVRWALAEVKKARHEHKMATTAVKKSGGRKNKEKAARDAELRRQMRGKTGQKNGMVTNPNSKKARKAQRLAANRK